MLTIQFCKKQTNKHKTKQNKKQTNKQTKKQKQKTPLIFDSANICENVKTEKFVGCFNICENEGKGLSWPKTVAQDPVARLQLEWDLSISFPLARLALSRLHFMYCIVSTLCIVLCVQWRS